jgi:hypothetical protein
MSYRRYHIHFCILILCGCGIPFTFLQAQTLNEIVYRWEKALQIRELDSIKAYLQPNTRIYLDFFGEKPGYYSVEQSISLIDKFIIKYQPVSLIIKSIIEEESQGFAAGLLKIRRDKYIYTVNVTMTFQRYRTIWNLVRIVVK